MIHVMKKIADWIVEHEEKDAEDCTVPDEVVQEWLETVQEKIKHMKAMGKEKSEQYLMLEDLEKKIEEIQSIRARNCRVK